MWGRSDSGKAVALLPNGDVVVTGQNQSSATAAFNTTHAPPVPIDQGSLGLFLLRCRPRDLQSLPTRESENGD